jgi:hypothetical protein
MEALDGLYESFPVRPAGRFHLFYEDEKKLQVHLLIWESPGGEYVTVSEEIMRKHRINKTLIAEELLQHYT